MQGLALATLDRELPPAPEFKGAPEWVHLLPIGVMQGRDGRIYDLADPDGLIQAFQANAIDLPVDFEHQADKPEAKLKGPIPAAGWIKELQQRANGIWGRVEWTATAAAMIAAKEYRYLSPSILYRQDTGEIKRLLGAGLVHRPNLFLTALASQDTTMPPDAATLPEADISKFLALVAKLLGLPVDAKLDELLSRLEKATLDAPDPAKYMPVAAVQEMLRDRNAERTVTDTRRIKEKVERALREHYITNGMREWALGLCQTNEAAFDSFCEGSGPMFAYLFKGSPAGSRRHMAAEVADTPLEQAICEQLGLKPGRLRD